MGFYVRKSIKAGPFRFNLSKSGIGVSTGFPGFRVGTGPRGNYVHMGRGGVYYRQSLGAGRSSTPSQVESRPPASSGFSPNEVLLEDVTGASALTLESTGAGAIVEQLNAAAKHIRVGVLSLISVIVVGLFTVPVGLLIWLLGVPLSIWLIMRDNAKRKVVLFYDVEDVPAVWFDRLVTGWPAIADSQKVWRETQSGSVDTVRAHKANAGAGHLVKREVASADLKGPKHLATNVAVPSINVGSASLHFLPDRILVRDKKVYSDVSYAHLQSRAYQTRFIENPGQKPKDSQQVGQTYQYVNVKGGPDGRYKNNAVLPIMLYGHLDLTSTGGLNWRVQTSRPDAASAIADTLADAPR